MGESVEPEQDRPDAALLTALNEVREAARAHFDHDAMQARMGVWLKPLEPRFHELAMHVRPVMQAHPQLGVSLSRWFGPKQVVFDSAYQVGNLIRVAVERSPQEAIDWMRRAMAIDRTDIRFVAELYGIKVEHETRLSNGVTLVPLAELPPSENARAVQAQFGFRPGEGMPRMEQVIGAYYCETNVPDERVELANARSRVLERTVQAFTLAANAAPVIGTNWIECVEPDLFQAEFGRMWGASLADGRLPSVAREITADDLAAVERYLGFPDGRRAKFDVPLLRLNRARRRVDSGDQAIEVGICLESLLGDENDQQDLSHKVRTRAALLLATEITERKAIRDDTNRLYKLRSTTVHGRVPKAGKVRGNREIATRGLQIASRVLHTIFVRDDDFDPAALDLGG